MCTSFRSRIFLTSCSLIYLSLAFSLAIVLACITSAVAISASSSSFCLLSCSNSTLCIYSLLDILFITALISLFLSCNSLRSLLTASWLLELLISFSLSNALLYLCSSLLNVFFIYCNSNICSFFRCSISVYSDLTASWSLLFCSFLYAFSASSYLSLV